MKRKVHITLAVLLIGGTEEEVREMEKLWEQVMKQLDPRTNLFKVLVYLAFSKEPCRPAEISNGTGISPGTIRPALRSLLKMGFVGQEPDGSYKSKIPFTEIISDVFQHPREK